MVVHYRCFRSASGSEWSGIYVTRLEIVGKDEDGKPPCGAVAILLVAVIAVIAAVGKGIKDSSERCFALISGDSSLPDGIGTAWELQEIPSRVV